MSRRRKVGCTLHSHRRKDPDHAHFDQRIEQPVPWIRMSGHWLAKAGFATGTPFNVQVEDGRITLTAQQETTT